MSVRLKKIPDEWRPNKEVINYKNAEGWEQYKTATDEAADRVEEIANDRELSIDEVRERINALDEKLQRECFRTTWIKPNRKPGTKPKKKMEADKLFKEHLDELLKMTDAGADFKDEQRRLWKLKEKVVGPKVGPAEPAFINDPTTGELITNKEEIKSKSLAHCVKIHTKNPIRECDREELKHKEENHQRIMNRGSCGSYKLDKKPVQNSH